MMQHILSGILVDFYLKHDIVHCDDILVYTSGTEDFHMKILEEVSGSGKIQSLP